MNSTRISRFQELDRLIDKGTLATLPVYMRHFTACFRESKLIAINLSRLLRTADRMGAYLVIRNAATRLIDHLNELIESERAA